MNVLSPMQCGGGDRDHIVRTFDCRLISALERSINYCKSNWKSRSMENHCSFASNKGCGSRLLFIFLGWWPPPPGGGGFRPDPLTHPKGGDSPGFFGSGWSPENIFLTSIFDWKTDFFSGPPAPGLRPSPGGEGYPRPPLVGPLKS